ncbi:MAG TPA: hypothetical protein PLO67_07205 [Saprospiraceae bacterium]|nr:hypothetical protein [Saprospiraceae bacterium]HPI06724.1 hypothetical protein [Saprospiraceae bacterium]
MAKQIAGRTPRSGMVSCLCGLEPGYCGSAKDGSHAVFHSSTRLVAERFLASEHYDVFTFGRPPVGIDILTQMKGVDFNAAFERSEWFEFSENLSVRSLHLSDLLEAKRSAGRPKDLDDLENLKV